jgi:probable addiction module antidote protein
MTIKIAKWDTADYLKTKEDVAGYLDAALEDGDPKLLKVALGNVARSKGMTEIAGIAGLSRASLYKALSPRGNPEFATVTKVLKALGLRLSVAAEALRRPTTQRHRPLTAPLKPRGGSSARFRR